MFRPRAKILYALGPVLTISIWAHATPAAQTLRLLDYSSAAPDHWVAEPAQTSMRLVQFRLPPDTHGEAAEFIVYYFGAGQGGSVDANIARWQGQFSDPGGGPVSPAVRRFEVSGLPVTTAEFRGNYARGIGVGPVGEAKPDRVLLAAIIETPRGNLTAQLHGPAALVDRERIHFDAFLRGLKPAVD